MKTIYYLAISIPKSMASISSGEKCCSLKLPGIGQAGKWVLERLKLWWWRASPMPWAPTCPLLPAPGHGQGPQWVFWAGHGCQAQFGMAGPPLEPLGGLSLVPTGQVGHALHFLQKEAAGSVAGSLQKLCYPAYEHLSMAKHKPTQGPEQTEEALWSFVLPAPAHQKGLK